ncbi:18802_t:CDS:2 [Entrophospora sp. SA101]|nr:12451_t:CDS:2 [Entrophospora sp. SA101]CAJ0753452.1 21563_t:CDS:2 [Entrophospora sp. SA101]CAJ0760593.1 18802_t:CDS:2 [Entrophospora sp. SA101]
MSGKIEVYYSSVSGDRQANKITYHLVDISSNEEALKYLKRKSKAGKYPQIFVDGAFKCYAEELEEQNEFKTLINQFSNVDLLVTN